MARTPEELRAYKRDWARRKREQAGVRAREAAAAKLRRGRDPEHARSITQRYEERHRDARNAEANRRQQAAWAAMTPEQRREVGRQRRARDMERRPEAIRSRKRAEAAAVRLEVVMAYGGRCACCGTDYLPHLTIDHVDGGGGLDRRQANGTKLYWRIRREGFPDRYQLLCFNCNWAKHALGACGCQGARLREVG